MILENNRTFISFLTFGLLNNILYVVILSAAVDLVGSLTPKAVVLLADILPAFIIKLTAPFFIHKIPYTHRIWSLMILSSLGMVIISMSGEKAILLKILGICMASLSSGLGELTFLQLTHFYAEIYSIGGFSMGTGFAGLGGSFMFLLLTSIFGLESWVCLLMFAVVPMGFVVVYYVVLPRGETIYQRMDNLDRGLDNSLDRDLDNSLDHSLDNSLDHSLDNSLDHSLDRDTNTNTSHFSHTISLIKPLLKPFMIPLCTVYISEYVINQGISPTLLFPLKDLPSWLFKSYRDLYVVYGFLYQLGVFISRSSITFGIRFRNLYIFSVLQFVNVIILLFQSVYSIPFSHIWLLLVLILYEGLLGGFSYVNTFVSVSEDTPKSRREFSMGVVGMSDSLGIVLAGVINWFLERNLCRIQVSQGREMCMGSGK